MPRKRKRSTLQRKPSLLFIESPVHVQRNVPSPVFCARHPPTASAVPIDNIQQLSWVSPQFRSSSGSDGRQKISRRRRKSIACLRNLNKENHDNHEVHRYTNIKYRSLNFVNDASQNTSEVEDIHITVDSDTATEDDQVRKQENSITGKCYRDKIKVSNHLKRNAEVVKSSDSERDQPLGNIPECDDVHANCDTVLRREADNRDLNESSLIDFTQVRKRPISVAPVKRLFASQLIDAGHVDSDGAEGTENDIHTCNETEPETVSESESGVDITPPVRRSLRIHMLQSMLQATPAPYKSSVVLAPDTPEDEYGWTLRKRQLRNYIPNR